MNQILCRYLQKLGRGWMPHDKYRSVVLCSIPFDYACDAKTVFDIYIFSKVA